ncbi:MAG: GspH/FimT family pseudopilin [Deltaproteobacteria bacterium]|nr:GspH/FimT family pseudopilin [Deltaproteobacteria bacterium]
MRRGFSLLELLVVLVIIALGYAFVGPRIGGSFSNLSLKTASKRISASLRYARNQASSENRTVKVLFDFDNNRMAVSAQGSDDKMRDERSEEADEDRSGSKIYSLPDGVSLEKAISVDRETESGIFEIVFFPTGGSSGGEVVLKNDKGNRYRISVDFITGTVQLGEE